MTSSTPIYPNKEEAELLAYTESNGLSAKKLFDNIEADPGLIEARDEYGHTLIHYVALGAAATQERVVVLKKLVLNGLNPNATGGPNLMTALHYAVKRKDGEVVNALLESGANPDIRDDCGNSSLRLAVQLENPEMLQLLARSSADVPQKLSPNWYLARMTAFKLSHGVGCMWCAIIAAFLTVPIAILSKERKMGKKRYGSIEVLPRLP